MLKTQVSQLQAEVANLKVTIYFMSDPIGLVLKIIIQLHKPKIITRQIEYGSKLVEGAEPVVGGEVVGLQYQGYAV